MNTVIGYDLKSPLRPSSFINPRIHCDVPILEQIYNLYLITSLGAMKKSWANVVDAPINIVLKMLYSLLLTSIFSLRTSYIKNYAACAGTHPYAIASAPWKKPLNKPSSWYKILAVLAIVSLPFEAYKCVFNVSIGNIARCSTTPAHDPATQCLIIEI